MLYKSSMLYKSLSKWSRPKREDRRDKRCAFVTKYDEEKQHSRITYRDWCEGCGFYVCNKCHEGGFRHIKTTHNVLEHVDETIEDEEDSWHLN